MNSLLGEGSTFVILLPLSVESQELNDNTDSPETSTHAIRGKVLVVDDEEAILRMSEIALRNHDFSVATYLSADSAYAKFRDDPEYFDIVVTDFDLSGMSGLQLGRAIHQMRTRLPVILTTGNPDAIAGEDLTKCGFREVIKKPFGPQTLSKAVIRNLADE